MSNTFAGIAPDNEDAKIASVAMAARMVSQLDQTHLGTKRTFFIAIQLHGATLRDRVLERLNRAAERLDSKTIRPRP
jgi:hypothetical protein